MPVSSPDRARPEAWRIATHDSYDCVTIVTIVAIVWIVWIVWVLLGSIIVAITTLASSVARARSVRLARPFHPLPRPRAQRPRVHVHVRRAEVPRRRDHNNRNCGHHRDEDG